MKKVGKHSSLRDEPTKKRIFKPQHLAGAFAVVPLLALTIPTAHALTVEQEPGQVKVAPHVEEFINQSSIVIPSTESGDKGEVDISASTGLVKAEKAPEPEPEPEPEEIVEEAAAGEAASDPEASLSVQEELDIEEPQEGDSNASEGGSGTSEGSSSGSSNSDSSGSDDSSSSGPDESHGSVRDAIIAEAKKHLGTPYVWGGSTPSGFDCSGYTSWVYKHAAGINLPRTSGAQLSAGKRISQSEAKPGDIVHMPGHVGIYAGNGMMYHAPSSGDVVKLAKIWTSSYSVVSYL